jgi:predicted metal-binding membrane protein
VQPAPPAPGSLAARTRVAIGAGLAGTAALAWLAIVRMEQTMWGMPMAGLHPWSALDFAMMLAMWVVMMVGMMVPSAAPAVMIYAQVERRAAREGHVLAPTAVFVAGYLLAWALFSVGATLAQWGLERAALLSPMWVTTSPKLGAGLLVAAGVHQLTPWKEACLRHCRTPARSLSAHWRAGASGALRLGMRHGFSCIGCCALLMGLLFVGGVMNLVWIAGITLFVLLEKTLPLGRAGTWLSALGLIATGGWALARGL